MQNAECGINGRRVFILHSGKALPIVRARLKIGDVEEAKAVAAGDKEVVFAVKLKAATRTRMQSWFYDADGKELCGAYFAYVRRK